MFSKLAITFLFLAGFLFLCSALIPQAQCSNSIEPSIGLLVKIPTPKPFPKICPKMKPCILCHKSSNGPKEKESPFPPFPEDPQEVGHIDEYNSSH